MTERTTHSPPTFKDSDTTTEAADAPLADDESAAECSLTREYNTSEDEKMSNRSEPEEHGAT
jgi:hypothetical protein